MILKKANYKQENPTIRIILKSQGKIIILTTILTLFLTGNTYPNLALETSNSFVSYELKNGLKVVLLEDKSVPVATVMMTYMAGLGDETGYPKQVSHLLEHMVMKSTKRFNAKTGRMPFSILQEVGALMNAMTAEDKTIYYETLPSSQIELALDIQADRMRNTLFRDSDISREKKVVEDELFAIANSPLVALSEKVWHRAYLHHPYRYGSARARKEVSKITKKNLQKFYDSFYYPNNAVLVIVGDFSQTDIQKIIEEKFSKIKPNKKIERLRPTEPSQNGRRSVILFREDPIQAISIAHKAPPATHPDFFALYVLAEILSSGRTSRLYPILIESGLSAGLVSEISLLRDSGLFATSAYLTYGVQHKKIGALINQVYQDIETNGVTPRELQIAKQKLRAKTIFRRNGTYDIAEQIADSVSLGSVDFYKNFLQKVESVTTEDIKRVANVYLVQKNMTVGYLTSRKKAKKIVSSPKSLVGDLNIKFPTKTFESDKNSEKDIAAEAESQYSLLDWNEPIQNQIIVKNVNGIKFICVKTGTKGSIHLSGFFEGMGTAFSAKPLLSEITISLMGRATKKHSADELAEILESRGIEMNFSEDNKHLLFELRALKENTEIATGILAETIFNSVFNEKELRQLKEQMRVQILEKSQDPFEKGYLEFKRMMYGRKHPNYRPSFEEELKSLELITLKDIQDFYKKRHELHHFVIIALGDVSPELIEKKIRSSFKGFKIKALETPYDRSAINLTPAKKNIFISGKSNIEVFLGHPTPLNQSKPDYLAASLGNFIFGGNFSARLLARIREELGLTYHIASNFSGMSGSDFDGHWVVNFTSKKDSLAAALEETKKQIMLFLQNGITPEELERNKRTVIGRFQVELGNVDGFSAWLKRNEILGFGVDYLDKMPVLINNLKLEEVNHAIRHYIRPFILSEVISGNIDD